MPRKNSDNSLEHKINSSKLAKYVLRAQKGDKKALEHIISITGDYIYYYCLTLLCDEQEAREAVQDIYVIVLKKLSDIRDAESFLKWLKVVSSNYCKNRLTRTRQNAGFDENSEFIEGIEDNDRQIIPEECIEIQEIRDIIVSAVNQLPDCQKQCVLMHYYYQMSIKQISAALNVKEGTVKSRLFNARKSIKSELEKYGRDNITFSGFSPMAYIAYSLLCDCENYKSAVTANSIICAEGGVCTEAVLDSQSVLSAAVNSFSASAAAKTALSARIIAAIACAGVIAAGSVIAYNINHGMPAAKSDNLQSTEIVLAETADFSMEQLYTSNGFTKDDRRRELLFDEAAELNSDETKEYVYDRMLNAIDYFDTLAATYYYSTGYSAGNTAYYSTYCIQQGDNPKAKEIIYTADGNMSSYCVLDGKLLCEVYVNGSDEGLTKILGYDESVCKRIASERSNALLAELSSDSFVSRRIYDTKEMRATDFVSLVDSRRRIQYSQEDGETVIHTRNDCVGLALSKAQYFSQSIAVDFLPDFDNWSIDEIGNILGRQCFVISGKSSFNGISDFEMCVDRQIGALLSFEGYDSNGGRVLSLITDEFTVDKQIVQAAFDDLSPFGSPLQK